MNDIYVVAEGRSVSTQRGVIGPGKEITNKGCKNFNTLISLGWIIKKENMIIKNKEDEKKIEIAHIEKPAEKQEKIKIEKIKKEKKNKKIEIEQPIEKIEKPVGLNFGAVKNETEIEKETKE